MSEPRTAAGRALLNAWKRDPKELWTVEQTADAIIAIEAEAAALDVERLADAWANVMDGRRIGDGLNAARVGRDTTTANDWRAIAREYAALAEPIEVSK